MKGTFKRVFLNFRNAKIEYRANGTKPKDWDIGMAVVAYDAYGSNHTLDNIASFRYNF